METNYGFTPKWSQPIIHQPEIGILGILARRINGILHFLMQLKTEPGNLGGLQLAPTLQATRSNFTCAHKGRQPPYLEYFLDFRRHRALVDVLQSEQGARFLRKRNRNVILEVTEEIPVLEDFRWLTLGQIQQLMQQDNVVNMCTRTVLSCIKFSDGPGGSHRANHAVRRILNRRQPALFSPPDPGSFQIRLLASEMAGEEAVLSDEEILAWFTRLKFRYELNVERIPFKFVQDWVRTPDSLKHAEGKFFEIIGVRFEAASREVAAWSQPLVRQRQEGIVAFIVKEFNGVLHFLVQGKVEVGNFDVVEMAATVQCVTGSYRDASKNECPIFLDHVLDARPERVLHASKQSEEGGRFFQEQNITLVVEAGADFPQEIPENFVWMTLGQLKHFIRYNNFVNAQARCLLSCLALGAQETAVPFQESRLATARWQRQPGEPLEAGLVGAASGAAPVLIA